MAVRMRNATPSPAQLPLALFFFRVEDPRMGNPRDGCFARLVAAVPRWGVRFRFDAFCIGSGFFMTVSVSFLSERCADQLRS
jgi:hypothetical protein